MGKNNLIKSTTRKKTASKEQADPQRRIVSADQKAKSAKLSTPAKTKKVTTGKPMTQQNIPSSNTSPTEKDAAPEAKTFGIASIPADSDSPTTPKTEESGPINKLFLFGIAVFLLLAALIIGSSLQNQSKYHILSTNGAIDIWQGKFAPMGKRLLISLPGALPPKSIKPVYAKEEAFSLAFDYYIEKADAFLDIPGMPDFTGIKACLNKSLAFATSEEQRDTAYSRLNTIDLMTILYRADAAASKNTLKGFESALAALQSASSLKLSAVQTELIQQKISELTHKIADVKASQSTESEASEKPVLN